MKNHKPGNEKETKRNRGDLDLAPEKRIMPSTKIPAKKKKDTTHFQKNTHNTKKKRQKTERPATTGLYHKQRK